MAQTYDELYGADTAAMQDCMHMLAENIRRYAVQTEQETGMNPVEHLKCRIKSEDSMREKCRRLGLPETKDSALHEITDAIGLRVVCPFLEDVYRMRDYIAEHDGINVVQEKDYIRNVKPNGYRSYHMILQTGGYYVEVQIRTISMDTWAALEHQIRYKKLPSRNEALLMEELKRCADELASTDASLQTIRTMLQEENTER